MFCTPIEGLQKIARWPQCCPVKNVKKRWYWRVVYEHYWVLCRGLWKFSLELEGLRKFFEFSNLPPIINVKSLRPVFAWCISTSYLLTGVTLNTSRVLLNHIHMNTYLYQISHSKFNFIPRGSFNAEYCISRLVDMRILVDWLKHCTKMVMYLKKLTGRWPL